ncbi:copper-resistant cuproprotein CopI [Vibrio sp. RC27]
MKKTLITLALVTLSSTAIADEKHNHSEMSDMKMDHAGMSMEGMSDVGMPAMGAKPDKVVHVLLSDDKRIRFKKEVKIESNDVVQFVIMNTGSIEHLFSIGSSAEHVKLREMMKNMNAHDSDGSVVVKPGKARQLLWHFHGDKNVELACDLPGHAEAGMVKKITL